VCARSRCCSPLSCPHSLPQIADWKLHKTTCKQAHKSAAPSGARGEDIPVTWEDQQHINEFSRCNLQMQRLDEDLKTARNAAANLEDAATDIDSLLDDDACKVRIGEVFMDVENDEAEAFVAKAKADNKSKVDTLAQQRVDLIKKMDTLKAILSAKFKNQINLENADQNRDE
jgi:prefoldin subunit 4